MSEVVLKKNELQEQWTLITLEDAMLSIRDGTHNPPKRVKTGMALLSARNIQNNSIDWSENYSFISKIDFNQITKNNTINENDILLTIVGTIGRSCVVTTSKKFTVQRSVAILKPVLSISSKYAHYFFQTPYFQKVLQKNSRGVAQVGVYLSSLKSIPFPLSPLNEQKRIVEKIEALFSLIDNVEKNFNSNSSKMALLRSSILKQAFEGKLVPQDLNDEPAEILLQKIKQEKEEYENEIRLKKQQLKQKQKTKRRSKNVK